MTLRITLLLMLVSVLGCASQIERVQTSQPTAEQTQEQAKKPALPTITYRPGFYQD
jgi:PBP1b-binding outer membrane lipoprotein LpoB